MFIFLRRVFEYFNKWAQLLYQYHKGTVKSIMNVFYVMLQADSRIDFPKLIQKENPKIYLLTSKRLIFFKYIPMILNEWKYYRIYHWIYLCLYDLHLFGN